MKWSSLRALGQSKVVQSSLVWLLVVPFAAKLLSNIQDVLDFEVFGTTVAITTSLPFSWQMLFAAACFFSVGNIIYVVFCPEIIRRFSDFSEYKDSGQTLAQIHSDFKSIAWCNKSASIKKEFVGPVSYYFKYYCGVDRIFTEDEINKDGAESFNDISLSHHSQVTNNAFYYVQTQCDNYNKVMLYFCGAMFAIGLFCISIIAIQNVIFVVDKFG